MIRLCGSSGNSKMPVVVNTCRSSISKIGIFAGSEPVASMIFDALIRSAEPSALFTSMVPPPCQPTVAVDCVNPVSFQQLSDALGQFCDGFVLVSQNLGIVDFGALNFDSKPPGIMNLCHQIRDSIERFGPECTRDSGTCLPNPPVHSSIPPRPSGQL